MEPKTEITKWLEFANIGEKCTSYKCPITIDKISEYNGFYVMYVKNFDKCIAIDKSSFDDAIKQLTGK